MAACSEYTRKGKLYRPEEDEVILRYIEKERERANGRKLYLAIWAVQSSGKRWRAKSAKKKQEIEIITVSKPGSCSNTAENGDTVAVHYTGKLQNGKIFDSSIEAKRDPIKFELGMGKVIKGWEKGILGMCVGEKRKLIIPPDLAYGDKGFQGIIPPDATLTFDTELIALEKNSPLNRVNIRKIISFAIWPVMILAGLVFLYQRMTAAEEKIKSEKSEKKSRKKKH